MSARPTPPALARTLLTRALPSSDRDVMIGDLDEEFRRRQAAEQGAWRVSAWYWRQALLSLPAAIRLRRRRSRRGRHRGSLLHAHPLQGLGHDLRYGLRLLARHPGSVVLTVAAHGLGIGVTTALATIAYGILLRPLPYDAPDRLFHVYEVDRTRQDRPGALSLGDFLTIRAETTAFERVGAYNGGSRTLTGYGSPERVPCTEVTDGFFETLGIRPIIGRTFDPAHAAPGAQRVVIVGHGTWQRRFGGDPSIVGRAITLNGEAHTVIGVLPAGFEFPLRGLTEFWLPLVPSRAQLERRYWHWLDAIGRLKPNVTARQARLDLDRLAQRFAADDPRAHSAALLGFGPLREQIVAFVRPALSVMLVAVILVFAGACASVAGLLLTRWSSRIHEIGLRAAIGAGSLRLVRQLLVESLLLAGGGAVLGIAAGHWLLRLFVSAVPRPNRTALPYLDSLTLDATAVGFALGVSLITGVAVGLIPAFAATRRNLVDTLRASSRTSSLEAGGRARAVLVAAQIALAVVLLTGAALLGRSMWILLNVPPGFDPKNLLTMRVNLSDQKYRDVEAVRQVHSQLLSRLSALPGALGVATIDQLPLTGSGNSGAFLFEGETQATLDLSRTVRLRTVTPNYVELMRVPLVRGRSFGVADREGSAHVVLVNRTFAERFTRGRDVVGDRIMFEFFRGQPQWEIVGVVGDEQFDGLDRPSVPVVYFPYAQNTAGEFNLVLRSAGDPHAQIEAARTQAAAVDPELPLFLIRTMEEILAQTSGVFLRRQVLALLTLFGAAALVVSTLGLYGVLAQIVVQRRRELGVRIALGAASSDVARLVFRQALTPAVAGIAAGVALSLAGARFATSLLFQIPPSDPWSLAAVCVLLLSVALLASLMPAWRASRVDPVTVLRE